METQPQVNSSDASPSGPSGLTGTPGTLTVDGDTNVASHDRKESSSGRSIEHEPVSSALSHPSNDNPILPVADTLANATSEAHAVIKDQVASVNTFLPPNDGTKRIELDNAIQLPVNHSEGQPNLISSGSQELPLMQKLGQHESVLTQDSSQQELPAKQKAGQQEVPPIQKSDEHESFPKQESNQQELLLTQESGQQELPLVQNLVQQGLGDSELVQRSSALPQHPQTSQLQSSQKLPTSPQSALIESRSSSEPAGTIQSTQVTSSSSEIQPLTHPESTESPQSSEKASSSHHVLSQEERTPKTEESSQSISESSSYPPILSEPQPEQKLNQIPTPSLPNNAQQSESFEEHKQDVNSSDDVTDGQRLSTAEPSTTVITETNFPPKTEEISTQASVPFNSPATNSSEHPDLKSAETDQPVPIQLDNEVSVKHKVASDVEASPSIEDLTASKKRNLASSEENLVVQTDQEPSRLSKRQKIGAEDHESSKNGTHERPEVDSAMEVDDSPPRSQSKLAQDVSETNENSMGESTSAPIRPMPTKSGGLPLLRSSPVFPQGGVRNGRSIPAEAKDSPSSNSDTTVRREKKKKSVSWATQDKLVEIHPIDTRIELVKSWDPDFQITLPFAPATLQMIQAIARSLEENGSEETNTESVANSKSVKTSSVDDGNNIGSIPMISSFEEARKKERDMELDRARQARDELKNRLNGMSAKRKWSSPRSVVLPAECEIEDKNMEKFCIVDADYESLHRRSDDMQSPSSPPVDWGWIDEGDVSDVHVRIFPLSEEAGGNGEGGPSNDGPRWNDSADRLFEQRDNNYFGGMAHSANMGVLGLRSVAPPAFVGRENEGRGSMRPQEGLRNIGAGNINTGRPGGLRGDKRRSSLPDNVRQLLSALQTSGVLKGTKLGDIGRPQSSEHMNGSGSGSGTGGTDGQEGYESRDVIMSGEEDGYVGSDDGGTNGQGHAGEVNGSGGSGGNGTGRLTGAGSGPNAGLGGPFSPGIGQSGLMDCLPFGMPPVPSVPTVPPGALGLGPNLLPMGMGLPLGPLGISMMPMAMGGGGIGGMNGPGMGGNSGGENVGSIVGDDGSGGGRGGRGGSRGGRGRHVETITRPKSKPSKNRKKCKYFGTKQGCRDGNACMFAHN